MFKPNVPAERIRAAVEQLEEAGLVVRREQREPGRPPTTVWALA